MEPGFFYKKPEKYATVLSGAQTRLSGIQQTLSAKSFLLFRSHYVLLSGITKEELTLPEDSNIYASKYQLYLPSKEDFINRLRKQEKRCSLMGNSIPENTEFLLFQTDNGKITIETRMEDETVWLSINQMAELFGVDKSGISRHLKNIFETGELSRDSVVANFATTAADSKVYQVEHYNLDGIISVGYRVNSIRGTQFRKWATERLKEYIIKGFTMNDELLKQAGGGNYFDELSQTE